MKRDLLAAVLLTFCLTATMFKILPTSSQSAGDYDPWYDINDDGEINMRDIGALARKFGSDGEPFMTKAGLLNDTGWVEITDKRGLRFNITHNLNSTDIMVDIQGKTTIDGGAHQRNLGGTGYSRGWDKTYGGTGFDIAYSVVQTRDGGYALAGGTQSFGAGNADFYLVKTDADGSMQWNKTYGGVSMEEAYDLIHTCDGGYAIAGTTASFGAGGDFWLVKTDALGNVQWNRTYGGTGSEYAYSVIKTSDGGYALTGGTQSFGAGGDDFYLVKTDADGSMQWNKTYGGTGSEYARSVVQMSDEGYAIAGNTLSGYNWDFWLVKTDANGSMQWNKTYGGAFEDVAYSAVRTCDGGCAIAGKTLSFGGGDYDGWLVKTDALGNVQWNKTYGGTDSDYPYSLIQTNDGGYAVAGNTSFSDGLINFWLVKTDALGNVEWNKTYGAGDERGYAVVQTSDGGYAIAGLTFSSSPSGDFYLVKTDSVGNEYASFDFGLAWTDSTADTITLYRGATDPWWNYVRVRIWEIKENP